MTELSNLLRQRLASGSRARVRPESHPDADTLTAYMEKLLPAAERNQVLDHLAACSHCREVAALALPESVAHQEAPAVTAPAARRWGFLWSPRFRIAASLATVAVVATILLQVRPKPQEQAKTDNFTAPSGGSAEKDTRATATPPLPEIAREAPAQPPSANDKVGLRGSLTPGTARGRAEGEAGKSLSNLTGAVTSARAASAHADGKAVPLSAMEAYSVAASSGQPVMAGGAAGLPHRDYVNQGFFANNAVPDAVNGSAFVSTNGAELPPAPSPRTSNQFPTPTVSVANIMGFADMPTQNTGTQTARILAPPSRSSHLGLMTTLTALGPKAKSVLRRTAPAIPPGATSFAMIVPGQPNPGVSEAAAAAPALDGGVSALEQSGAFRRRALSDASTVNMAGSANMKAEMLPESAPSLWRVSGGKLVRPGETAGTWVEACAGFETVQFATASAHGKELWAGGANAALIHSSDGGATCERVTLGASAIGTIVHIEARGAVVQVKSSSGQSWSSQDGGKTWKIDE